MSNIELEGTVSAGSKLFRLNTVMTNVGMDDIAHRLDYLNECSLGSGAMLPKYTDHTLNIHLISTTHKEISSSIHQDFVRVEKQVKFTFAPFTGTIREIGVGKNTSMLAFRGLITDDRGRSVHLNVGIDDEIVVIFTIVMKLPTRRAITISKHYCILGCTSSNLWSIGNMIPTHVYCTSDKPVDEQTELLNLVEGELLVQEYIPGTHRFNMTCRFTTAPDSKVINCVVVKNVYSCWTLYFTNGIYMEDLLQLDIQTSIFWSRE